MAFSLAHVDNPRKGDSGQMSMLITPGDPITVKHNAKPKVGSVIRVGSLYARTFVYQDWWQTSLITKILIDKPNYVKFKTLNSIYEWRNT